MAIFKDSACQNCEHYKPSSPMDILGICLHKDGPTRVYGFSMVGDEDIYPSGCPINPNPATPPRKRPGKNKRKKKPGPKYKEELE